MASKKKESPRTGEFARNKRLKRLLKEIIREHLENGNINTKAGDIMKIIEMQKKLSGGSQSEEKFWEMIEQIRQEELKNE